MNQDFTQTIIKTPRVNLDEIKLGDYFCRIFVGQEGNPPGTYRVRISQRLSEEKFIRFGYPVCIISFRDDLSIQEDRIPAYYIIDIDRVSLSFTEAGAVVTSYSNSNNNSYLGYLGKQ
jgi:hypothetical protein